MALDSENLAEVLARLADSAEGATPDSAPAGAPGRTALSRLCGHLPRHSLPMPIPVVLAVVYFMVLFLLLMELGWAVGYSWRLEKFWFHPIAPGIATGRLFLAVNLLMFAYVGLAFVLFLKGSERRRKGHWCSYLGMLVILGYMQMNLHQHDWLARTWLDREAKDTLALAIVWEDDQSLLARVLEHGANVNGRNYHQRIALHRAALLNLPGPAAVLLDHGANINAQDEDGNSPLHLAVRSGLNIDDFSIADFRRYGPHAAKPEPEVARPPFPTAVWIPYKGLEEVAIDEGNLAMVELLLSRGAEPNPVNKEGLTPLDLAKDFPKTKEILLRHGARSGAATMTGTGK